MRMHPKPEQTGEEQKKEDRPSSQKVSHISWEIDEK